MTEGVIVAIAVGIVGPIIVALIGLLGLRRRVGSPNGHGNVMEMLERLLHGQASQDQRLAELEANDNRMASQIGRVHQTLREREPIITAAAEHLADTTNR